MWEQKESQLKRGTKRTSNGTALSGHGLHPITKVGSHRGSAGMIEVDELGIVLMFGQGQPPFS